MTMIRPPAPTRHRRVLAGAAAAAAALAVGAAPASAAGLSAHDTVTLAAAVQSADSHSGPSTIDLQSGVYAPDATLTINGQVTISGPASGPIAIVGSAVAPAGSSVFEIGPNARVTLVDINVQTAGAVGGDAAVDVFGALDLESSTLAGNDGPDLAVEPGASATVRNTTLSDGLGAGVIDDGQVKLVNSTIAANGDVGVDDTSGALSLVNTIVAGNAAGDCAAPAASSDHSLDDDGSCGVGALSRVNPRLGPLSTANGGPTPTRALEAGSPAIGAGDQAACPGEDQRHYARADGHCDIGAYEAGARPSGGASAGGPATGGGGAAPSKRPAAAPSGSAKPRPTGISGHGSVRGVGRARISFTVHALLTKPHGSLVYHDPAGRVWLRSGRVASVRIDTGRGTATIKGSGTDAVHHRHVGFTAVVTDHAGARSVRLRLSTGYAGGGRLITGAIAFTGSTARAAAVRLGASA